MAHSLFCVSVGLLDDVFQGQTGPRKHGPPRPVAYFIAADLLDLLSLSLAE